MMYRCGWASKKNQERILAVRLTRSGFDTILANAYTAEVNYNIQIELKSQKISIFLGYSEIMV